MEQTVARQFTVPEGIGWPAVFDGAYGGAVPREPASILLLVVDGFSLVTLSGLTEPLKLVNKLAGRDHSRWRTIGVARPAAISASGIHVVLDGDLGGVSPDVGQADLLLVCAGEDVEKYAGRELRSFLKRMSRCGVMMGGIGTGAWLIADAGLLAGRDCTIHWSKMPAFSERFRDVRVDNRLIQQDEEISTCAGELAAFDFALDMVRRAAGHDAAVNVSHHFVTDIVRSPSDRQRLPKSSRYRMPNDPLIQVIAMMERSIAEPKPLGEIARLCGLSRRQIERLFQHHLNSTPYQHYLQLRVVALGMAADEGPPQPALGDGGVGEQHGGLGERPRRHQRIAAEEKRLGHTAAAEHGQMFDEFRDRYEIAGRQMRDRAVAEFLEPRHRLDLSGKCGAREVRQENLRAAGKDLRIGSELQCLLRRQFQGNVTEGEAGRNDRTGCECGVLIGHGSGR